MERAKARGSLGIALSDLALAVSSAGSVRARHVRAGFDPDDIARAVGTVLSGEGPPGAFAADALEAVAAARAEATALGHPTVRPVHLWLSVLERPAVRSALANHYLGADLIRQAMVQSLTTDE
ncbi:MAG: hypothetical protein DLM71_03990 [Chloroflexi bacterium]|nr:MAG: hypothetical protein DLM71_03990 [Chloroflexota bacterium]